VILLRFVLASSTLATHVAWSVQGWPSGTACAWLWAAFVLVEVLAWGARQAERQRERPTISADPEAGLAALRSLRGGGRASA
jgi:hypothetical protein